MKQTTRHVPYALRLPAKLHEALKRIAKANKRSLNSEIVIACEDRARAESGR